MRTSTIWLLAGLVAALGLFAFSRTKRGEIFVSDIGETVGSLLSNRGLRDNNPGNIRRTSTHWVGELSRTEVEAAGGAWDEDFEQFATMAQGIRALGHTLLTYWNKYSLNTVRGIVSRYAPPSENDTDDYVRFVADQLAVAPDETIDVRNLLPALATAIMTRETGFEGDPGFIATAVYS